MNPTRSFVPTLLALLAVALVSCSQPQSSSQNGGGGAPLPATTPAPPASAEIPSGTALSVRLDQALSTERNRAGDTFTATLDQPVLAQGHEILPSGTKFHGKVTEADASGRLQGRAVLGISLDSFELNGQRYPVKTSMDSKTGEAHKKRNIEIIGGGAGVGALIGGIVGQGKGAAIGAAAGAAAGTGGAAATGKENIEVPAESVFQFSLKEPVSVPM